MSVATEINVKTPPLPQKPVAQAPRKDLPQHPASKADWLTGEGDVAPDLIKVPDGRPDVIVFVKTEKGYAKVMELDRGGESLFGTGEAAREFTETLAQAISRKMTVNCLRAEGEALTEEDSTNIRYIKEQIDTRRKMDEFAAGLLAVGTAVIFLTVIIFMLLGKTRGRGP
jgi:hypothetical protein